MYGATFWHQSFNEDVVFCDNILNIDIELPKICEVDWVGYGTNNK